MARKSIAPPAVPVQPSIAPPDLPAAPFGEPFGHLPDDIKPFLTRVQWLLLEGLNVLEYLRTMEVDGALEYLRAMTVEGTLGSSRRGGARRRGRPADGALVNHVRRGTLDNHARRVLEEAQGSVREFHGMAARWLHCRPSPVTIPPSVARLLPGIPYTAVEAAHYLALTLAGRVLDGHRSAEAVCVPPEPDRWLLANEAASEARSALATPPPPTGGAAGEVALAPALPAADKGKNGAGRRAKKQFILSHGEACYSLDDGPVFTFRRDEDAVIQVFLRSGLQAMATKKLSAQSGYVNVSAIFGKLMTRNEGTFAPALRRPGRKGDGYGANVKCAKHIKRPGA